MEPVKRHVAGALALADHQLADVHREASPESRPAGTRFRSARVMISSNPPCTFTPVGSPCVMYRNGDADALGQIDALQIGVQQSALMGSTCWSTTITGVFSPPCDRQVEDGVVAGVAVDDLG